MNKTKFKLKQIIKNKAQVMWRTETSNAKAGYKNIKLILNSDSQARHFELFLETCLSSWSREH